MPVIFARFFTLIPPKFDTHLAHSVLSVFQIYPDISDINWSNNYNAGANIHVKGIEKSADAGFLAASNIKGTSGNDILLVKVNSVGLSTFAIRSNKESFCWYQD